MQAPQNPAGVFVPEDNYTAARREEFISVIETAPIALFDAVAGLSGDQLDTKYRDWTIRQIVHHLADSHLNSYIRFKWALTEELPTIKAYDEGRWAALDDSRSGGVGTALALFDSLHGRWVQLLRSMSEEQFVRCFRHPESGQILEPECRPLLLRLALQTSHGAGSRATPAERLLNQNRTLLLLIPANHNKLPQRGFHLVREGWP